MRVYVPVYWPVVAVAVYSLGGVVWCVVVGVVLHVAGGVEQ